MAPITYRLVSFENKIAEYEDLKTFGPASPLGNWYYLGPVAVTPESTNQRGLIVRADEPDALDEVVDWNPVFIDIEGGKFSTWRGIPNDPEKYVVIGDLFVTGIEKPTPNQTAGIRAIRKDLIDEVEPHHLVFKKVIPFAILTLWTVVFTVGIHIPTGAFVSSPGEGAESKLGVVRLIAAVQEAE